MKKRLAWLLAFAMALILIGAACLAESDDADAGDSAPQTTESGGDGNASSSIKSDKKSGSSSGSSSSGGSSGSSSSESSSSGGPSSGGPSSESSSSDGSSSGGSSSESDSGSASSESSSTGGSSSESSSDSGSGDSSGSAASDSSSGGESGGAASGGEPVGDAGGEPASAQNGGDGDASGSDDGVDPASDPIAPASGNAASQDDDDAPEGSESELVARIQTCLVRLKYLSEVTGRYDDATRQAIIRFQTDNGLPATGKCSQTTLRQLQDKLNGEDLGGSAAGGTSDAGEDSVDSETAPDAVSDGGNGVSGGDDGSDGTAASASGGNGASDGDGASGGGDGSDGTATSASPIEGIDHVDAESPEDEILLLQGLLYDLGWLTDSGDEENPSYTQGVFDDATLQAIVAFQEENGLDPAEGCDAATLRLLYELWLAQNGGGEEDGGQGSPGGGPGGGFPGGGGHGGFGGYGGGHGGYGGAAGGMAGLPEEDDPLNGITPGEALTTTHASGDRDAALYGTVCVELPDALDIALRTGATAEGLSEGDILGITVDSGTLALDGGNGAVLEWRFSGYALRTLSRSGIARLTLGGGGQSVTLPTSGLLTGSVYESLRAAGWTDNTFAYTVTLVDGRAEITAESSGITCDVIRTEDGACELSARGNGEGRA